MSSGGRGTYSIRIEVDAAQALATINSLTSQFQRLGPSLQGATGSLNQVTMQFTRFNTEAQKAVGTSSSLAAGLGQVRGPLGQLNSQIGTTAATLPKLSQAQQQAAQSSQQMGQAMQSNIQRMTALGSRIGGIAFMFTGLTAAMGEAQGMQSLLAESQKKEAEALAKMNDAISKYGKNSFQATQATQQWEKAQRAVAFQARITTLSIQDQFFFIGGLASIALPSVITAFGKLNMAMKQAQAAGVPFITFLQNSGGIMGRLTSVFGNFGGAVQSTTGQIRGFSPALAGMGAGAGVAGRQVAAGIPPLANIGIAAEQAGTKATGLRGAFQRLGSSLRSNLVGFGALAVGMIGVTVGLSIIANNTFGARTALDKLGVTIGKQSPFLGVFAEGLRDIAESLGLVPSNGRSAQQALASFNEETLNTSVQWAQFPTVFENALHQISFLLGDNPFAQFVEHVRITISEIVAALSDLPKIFGDAFMAIGPAVAQSLDFFSQIPRLLQESWGDFTGWVTQNIVAPLQQGFETLVGAAGQWGADILAGLQTGFGDLTGWITQNIVVPFTNAFGPLIDAAVQWGADILAGIQQGFADLAGWVTQNIVSPWSNAMKGLITAAATWGSDIFAGLTSGFTGLASWIGDNIITPFINGFNDIVTKAAEAGKAIMEALKGTVLGKGLEGDLTAKEGEPQTGLQQFLPKPEEKQRAGGDRFLPQGGNMPIGGSLINVADISKGEGLTQRQQDFFGLGQTEEIKKAETALDAYKIAQAEVLSKQKDLGKVFTDFQLAVKLAGGEIPPMTTFMKNYDAGVDITSDDVKTLADMEKAYTDTIGSGKDKMNAAIDVLKGRTEKMEEEKTVLGELTAANSQLSDKIHQTMTATRDGSLVLETQKQGMLEAKDAALNYGMEIEKSAKFNETWGQIIETAGFKSVAFEKGVQSQIKTLQDQKVSIMENEGVIAEYTAQVASGEAGNLAFAEGVQNQKIALLDSQVALRENAGTLQEYASQLADGSQQQVAFAEGQQQIQQSMLDSIRNTADLQGQIAELDKLLADGTAQSVAFAEGLAKGQLAARQMQTDIAASNGEIQGFREGLLAVNPALQELSDVSRLSNEQLQELAAAAAGSREQLMGLAEAVNKSAEGFGKWLEDLDFKKIDNNMREGIDDAEDSVDEFIDDLEDKGIEISETTKNNWKLQADVEPVKETINGLMTWLDTTVKQGDKAGLEAAGQGMIIALSEGMRKAAPTTKAEIMKIMQDIQALMDAPPHTEQFQTALTQLRTDIENFGGSVQTTADNIGGSLDQIAESGTAMAARLVQEFGSAGAAIDQLMSQFEQAASRSEQIGTLGAAKTLFSQELQKQQQQAPTAAPTVDTTAATKALQDLQLLATTTAERIRLAFSSIDFSGFTTALSTAMEPLSLLGPATTEAVGQMSAAFGSIDLSTFTTALQPIHDILTLLGPAAQEAVSQMSAAFASLDVSGALAALQPLHQALSLLGPATQQAAQQMSAALQTVASAAQQVGTQIQQSITAAIQAAASAVATAAGQMNSALATVQQAATTTAQSFAQIGTAAQTAASTVQSAAQTMASALQTVADAAAAVAESIRAIGAAADSARSSVEQLSTAIQNIPDGEAVIHVTYDVAPAPAGITPAFGGLGGGGGGIPGGASPGGIGGGGPSFGGGGIEPALQFPVQGGLGTVSSTPAADYNKLGILKPVLIDHPTKLLVGENGAELVSVTPVNRNRGGKTGELSPFIDRRTGRPLARLQGGFGIGGPGWPGFGSPIMGHGDRDWWRQQQQADFTIGMANINVMQGNVSGGTGINAGNQLTGGTGQFAGTNQFGQQQVPGGQVSTMGNAVACVNGQCFGNMSGFGNQVTNPLQQQQGTGTTTQQNIFQPIRDELTGMIKPIETLIEWFKFLGLPTGASTPGTGNFTNAGQFGMGGMQGGFGMGGGGATAVAGNGMAMASAGGAVSIAGGGGFGGGMFGGFGGGQQQGAGTVRAYDRNGNISTFQLSQIPLHEAGKNSNPDEWQIIQGNPQGSVQHWVWIGDRRGGGNPVTPVTFPDGWEAKKFIDYQKSLRTGGTAPTPPITPGFGVGGQGTNFFTGFGTGGMFPGGGGIAPTQQGNFQMQGNPALLNTPFFNNFFGGQNPFTGGGGTTGGFGGLPTGGTTGGTGGIGTGGCVNICGAGGAGFGGIGNGATATTGGIGPGMINMTGGNINFDSNQGNVDMRTSTGTIAVAGPGGAFAQAGGATAAGGIFAGGGFTPSPTEQAQMRELGQINDNLNNIGEQIGDQNLNFDQFQAQQTDFIMGPNGLVNQFQQFPQQMQTAFGTGLGQIFSSPGFTGFGQSFQSFPGGGAVGSGTNDPLGFLNSMLGGFGIPTPAGIPSTGGGTTGGVPSTGGTGAGGCINLCSGSLGNLGGGTGGGGGTGAPGSANLGGGEQFGGGGEPGFQGVGGIQNPGNTTGGNNFTPTGGGGNCEYRCRPMDSDPNRYRIDDAQGNEANGGVYYNSSEQCNQRLQELCPSGQQLGNNMTPAPTQNYSPFTPGTGYQPTGGNIGGNNQVSVMVNGIPMGQGFQPGVGGVMGPVGNPPVPPRIVQEAGLPSQAPNVNQDPTMWQIVESLGLVGTYDIIDPQGDVVMLGFRTRRDAEEYLNYFITYYQWVKSGSNGIPGTGGVGGVGGGTTGGVGGIGGGMTGTGGITATAGNAQASAGPGGAFASAGNALAQAFAGTGGTGKMLGPTPVPESPFEPIPRAQGPFRSGQDNQEPIYDNSGIKIGADFGSPDGGTTVTEEEVTTGDRSRRRRHRRGATAIATAGNATAIAIANAMDEFLDRFESLFGDMLINLTVNNMIDGRAVNTAMQRYQLKKISVFS